MDGIVVAFREALAFCQYFPGVPIAFTDRLPINILPKADTLREVLEDLMDDEDEMREMNISTRPQRGERRRQRERERLERERQFELECVMASSPLTLGSNLAGKLNALVCRTPLAWDVVDALNREIPRYIAIPCPTQPTECFGMSSLCSLLSGTDAASISGNVASDGKLGVNALLQKKASLLLKRRQPMATPVENGQTWKGRGRRSWRSGGRRRSFGRPWALWMTWLSPSQPQRKLRRRSASSNRFGSSWPWASPCLRFAKADIAFHCLLSGDFACVP